VLIWWYFYICTGPIFLYGSNGRAVQVSSTDVVVLSADDQGATSFQPVDCLVDDTALLGCVSLMDANRSDWYVRHRNYSFRVDPKHSTEDLPLFKADSSFVVHADTFYPGHYALESVNFRQHYISLRADGHLKIMPHDHITNLHDASFRVAETVVSCTYFRLFVYDTVRICVRL